MLPVSMWKLVAGAGLVVGGVLGALGVALHLNGLVQSDTMGFGAWFPFSIALWVLAVPLMLLGRIAWRRAHRQLF